VPIESIECFVIGPSTAKHTWASDLPEQFMTNTIVRLTSDDGCEGVAGVSTYSGTGFDFSIAETLRHMLPLLLGADPLDRERIWSRLQPTTLPAAPGACSAVDIALWDWLGTHLRQPIHKLLGGSRQRIQAYASTPLLNSAEAYVEFTSQLREEGFTAIKFHAWCEPDRDLDMVRAVRRVHTEPALRLMFDAENRYDRRGALRVALELQDLGFHWFEAPLPDLDLDGYRSLRSHVRIPILPAGNWVLNLQAVQQALGTGAWDAARVDVSVCGGITAARKVMAIAEAGGCQCELQCWGYTLSQAANLQTMLGLPNCSFFEQPVPYDSFEYGMLDVIRPRADGYIYAADAAGLGVRVDWDAIRSATLLKIEVRT
jgi:L-alanine-DL-glutamate epimerase-like enolase superfamily enzyme